MIQIISNIGVVILLGVLAFMAGMFGNLESNMSSENPNSLVLHAPRRGHLHKLFTKVVSSTSILITTMATISGSLMQVLLSYNIPVIIILVVVPLITTIIHVIIMATSYMSQMTSQALYDQPLYVDVLYNNIPTIAAYSFICLFSITLMGYILVYVITPPLFLSLPIVTFILGILLGCITSVIGDIYFGAEVLYQHRNKKRTILIEAIGDITTHGSLSSRNSLDILYLTSKFSGPITGLCFGLIIFLIFWGFIAYGQVGSIIAGFIFTIILTIINYILDVSAHKRHDNDKGD